ncbi:DNA replication initiation factor cdc45 [Grosmannia clavigera kw1407]|uniref:DNA replication initiation factor cdc45 n=1 Tax=Grosmannia clavigera (strain kw1407 / UAMH 11150) TaxID=655863 RepID=F0XFL3_GROCL|nr:DNA replication initiation factor cdc45 [Grosmannia clavigera kw1407]EFX04368.1 DNA replication initiation factor cdc45 [Grosmannia clavigera kw1407]
MGVPKLLATLTPYGDRRPLEAEQVVIDGPALAYHAASLCQAVPQPAAALSHTFDQATSSQLGQAALVWLDELRGRGNTISALFFDGYLPRAKRPTRLERTYRTSMQLKDIFVSYQREMPGYETGACRTIGRLPAPAFVVPAVLDALRRSPVYGPMTRLVPGEADTFCAQHVRTNGRGTVITSDSDLLVHDLGPDGNVVFFRDIDLRRPEAGGPQGLVVPVFSPTMIRSRLALSPLNGMQAFAFELFMDPHLSINGLIERARQQVAVTRYPEEYVKFLEQYDTPGLLVDSARQYNLNGLDPRMSEYVLQCLLPPGCEAGVSGGRPRSTDSTPDDSILIFVPQMLESWTRASSWEISAPLRQCAYGLLQAVAGRRILAVREYTRMASMASLGGQLQLPSALEITEAVGRLTSILRQIQTRVQEPSLWWIVLSSFQDIEWSREQAKESVCLTVLCKETPADGILQRPSWNAAHWIAQIMGTLYSLRILRQLVEFVGQDAGEKHWKQATSGLSELRELLSLVTPLEEYPSLRTLQYLPARLRESGALDLISEMAGLPSPIDFLPGTRRKRSNKKRKRLSQPSTMDDRPPCPTQSRNLPRRLSPPPVTHASRVPFDNMYLPRSLISKLYLHLQNTCHPLSPPVLLLVALEPDALCACRVLTSLLKHDYIPHKIQPVAGYADLARVGRELVAPMMQTRGGNGGVVICLGVGGTVDLATFFGLETDDEQSAGGDLAYGGVEVWILDAHRPWNLNNVFGGFPLEPAIEGLDDTASSRAPPGVKGGRVERAYKPGKGGLVVFDDGDVEDDLDAERDAYLALADMPEVDEDGDDPDLGASDTESGEDGDVEEDVESADGEAEPAARAGQKRKSLSDHDDEPDSEDDNRPAQRRRSNSSSPIALPARPKSRPLLVLRGPPPRNDVDPTEAPQLKLPVRQTKKAPSARTLRRRLLQLRARNEAVLRKYYRKGASYSEPISSMAYSLASELGREDNDLLWLTIVGVTSMELYGRSSAGVAVKVHGAESMPTAGWMGMRGARIRQLLRDEVRRLNPPEAGSGGGGGNSGSSGAGGPGGGRMGSPESAGVIPTTARSPEDTSIRLSPEPKFLLIRHWSLYDSMLHSPYLFSRLKMWSETGLKRLHKLFAKMGVSLVQCRQSYAHMDMMLKRELRVKLLKRQGPGRAGKDGWGFVRSWGWRATLSAQDVAVVIGALLEVGKSPTAATTTVAMGSSGKSSSDGGPGTSDDDMAMLSGEEDPSEEWVPRFWEAYDALESIESLKEGLPTAKFLHRAIFNTGSALIKKKQITHLHAFRMCIVKEGPDVGVFNHPGALTKLALWVGEALAEQEKDATGRLAHGGRGTPLVVASLNEKRGVYVVVGTGGGGGPDMLAQGRQAVQKKQEERAAKTKQREERREARRAQREEARTRRKKENENKEANDDVEDEDDEDEDEDEGDESEGSETDSDSDSDSGLALDQADSKSFGLNRFGTAFQDVVAETSARVRIDSFEHCVVEVKKEDLSGFLESLSMKAVVG